MEVEIHSDRRDFRDVQTIESACWGARMYRILVWINLIEVSTVLFGKAFSRFGLSFHNLNFHGWKWSKARAEASESKWKYIMK